MEVISRDPALVQLESWIERISDQQAFTESLLAEREPLLVAKKAETGSVSSS